METNDLKILAIDNNRDNLAALNATVSDGQRGTRLLTALDGPRGLELAHAEDPDVILLSIAMPGMSGFAICRKLKEDERLRTIPVLFLTADKADRDNRIKALEAGAEGFLSMPLDEVELTTQIRTMAKIKAANRLGWPEKEQLAVLVSERTQELEHELAERKRVQEQNELLGRMALRLAACNGVENMVRTVEEDTSKLLTWDSCFFAIRPPGEDTFHILYSVDTVDGKKREFSSDSWLVSSLSEPLRPLVEGDPVLINRAPGDSEPRFVRFGDDNRPSASLMYAPIRSGGKVIGILSAQSYTPFRYHGNDLSVLQRVADMVAPSLESEQRFRTILENSVDAAYRRNLQTDRFDYISPVIEQITGFSAEEMLQSGNDEVLGSIHPDDVPTVQRTLEKLTGGGSATVEYRFKCKDGQYRWLANAFRIMIDEQGRPSYQVGVFRDIGTRKLVEEERERLQAQLRQAQKMEAMGRLSGVIAHDFNNLLTVIQGNTDIASMKLQTEMTKRDMDRVAAALEEIEQASERASNLTGQLLTFSRKYVAHPNVLDMGAVVRDMEKMLRRLIREDIAFEIASDPGEHLIQADKTQIEQVLVNLTVNACDAMPDGGKLTMRVSNATLDEAYAKKHSDARTGPHVLISVADTGVGMASSTLDHLFEPFFTTKPYGKGTGLGLSIVYGIVKTSGGHIVVTSKPGKGSTFKLYIPVVKGEASKPAAKSKPDWEGGNETILLCEDEVSLRRMAASILTESGYTVIEAQNSEHAVQLAAEHKGAFQLLITDVIMPGIKGDKVAAAILKDQPNVQVLFMSGYVSDVLSVESISAKGVEFLQKPFKPQVFLQRVREILNKSRK